MRRYQLAWLRPQPSKCCRSMAAAKRCLPLPKPWSIRSRAGARVVMPNPFYQIYEGAALLAGAAPEFINILPQNNYRLELEQLSEAVWANTQLHLCMQPGQPHRQRDDAGRLGASCSRCRTAMASSSPATSAIRRSISTRRRRRWARCTRRTDWGAMAFPRLVVFGSLSKRSNVPGMRSGYVAGDAAILEKFLLYRTYQGCAMNPAVQAASRAAWDDEDHVRENRRLYREKFEAVTALLRQVCDVRMPEAAFYLWLRTPIADTEFARRLYETYNVTVLPGSYLAREARGVNPGATSCASHWCPIRRSASRPAQRLKAFLSELT